MDAVKLPAGMRECPSETIRDRIDVGEAGWEVITTRDTHTIGVILTAVVAVLLAGRAGRAAAAAAITTDIHAAQPQGVGEIPIAIVGMVIVILVLIDLHSAAVTVEGHARAALIAGRAVGGQPVDLLAAAAVKLEDHVRAMLPAGRAVGGQHVEEQVHSIDFPHGMNVPHGLNAPALPNILLGDCDRTRQCAHERQNEGVER